MNAMRPWAHESDLARYLDNQRTIARARTPATPTLPHAQVSIPHEDIRRVEQITTALHNLQLRLTNSDELVENAGHLVDYLNELQSDLQFQTPEQTFPRLQPLRDLIFWLPPAILRSGESDLAALTLLAHLYATALAIEQLFPDIGGAYLGSMSVLPLECINEILKGRRNSQPQDTSVQMASQLMEVPAQILSAYRLRQRHNSQGSQSMDVYRHSPSASPYVSPHMPISSSGTDISAQSHYSNSSLHGHNSLPLPGSSYFPGISNAGDVRRDSSISSIGGLGRAHSMTERTMSSGSIGNAMAMVYASPAPQHQHHPRSSHELSGSRMDYFGQAPYNPYGGINMNTRFVTPSQLWA